MLSEKMVTLGTKKSVIREIFEYSKKRAAEIGAEAACDGMTLERERRYSAPVCV